MGWIHKKIRKLIRWYIRRAALNECVKQGLCHEGCPYCIREATCISLEIERMLKEMDGE